MVYFGSWFAARVDYTGPILAQIFNHHFIATRRTLCDYPIRQMVATLKSAFARLTISGLLGVSRLGLGEISLITGSTLRTNGFMFLGDISRETMSDCCWLCLDLLRLAKFLHRSRGLISFWLVARAGW